MNQPQYKSWKDRGDNIGIQCTVCFRTHWNSDAPATDPTTGKPCDNCQGIKDQHLLEEESRKHNQEIDEYKQKVNTSQNPGEVVFACSHIPSQP